MKSIISLSSAIATRQLPLHPIADGIIHRFVTIDRPGDQAGWYVYHSNGVGKCGCWRTGESTIFLNKLKSRPADQTEQLQQARQALVESITQREEVRQCIVELMSGCTRA